MSERVENYELRSARPSERDRVLEFCAENNRSQGVFRKTDDVINETIADKRCLILERGNAIIASASLMMLPGSVLIGKDEATGKPLRSEVIFADMEIMFRQGAWFAGMAADLLCNAAVLTTCVRAMELSVSQLTMRVGAAEEVAAKWLVRSAVPWKEFNPNRGNNLYLRAFLSTLAGRTEAERESRRTPLRTFYTPVSSVVDAAENLVGGSGVFFCKPEAPRIIYTYGRQREKGAGPAPNQTLITIDLRSMPDLFDLAVAVVSKADTLRGALTTVTWPKAVSNIRKPSPRNLSSPIRPQPRDAGRTTQVQMGGIAPAAA